MFTRTGRFIRERGTRVSVVVVDTTAEEAIIIAIIMGMMTITMVEIITITIITTITITTITITIMEEGLDVMRDIVEGAQLMEEQFHIHGKFHL